MNTIALAHVKRGPFEPSELPHDAFDGEPLTVAYKFSPESLAKYFAFDRIEEVTKNGLSVRLVEGKEGKTVGYRLSEDLTEFMPKVNLNTKGMEKLQPYTSKAFEIYKKTFIHLEKGEVVHFSGLGISPCYRGNGYGHALVKEAIEIARERGFKAIVVETTGEFSYKTMIKHKFKVLEEIPYNDSKIPDPHTHFRILKLDLKSNSK